MPKQKQVNKTMAILGYLLRWGSIDRQRAATHFNVWDLHRKINALRSKGHDIKTVEGGATLKYTLPDVAAKFKVKSEPTTAAS